MTISRSSLILFGLGIAVAAYALRPQAGRRSTPSPSFPIRNAGREEMTMPPRHWDRQDETVDESFPASDPPGNY